MDKKVYCVIGLPLSGKTHFAKLIANKYRYGHVSTGDIARSLMDGEAQAAETRKADMFPDEQRLRDNLIVTINSKPQSVVLVDGFPRSGDQVDFMINNMAYWFPEVIDVAAGDDSTLLRRARERQRDVGDSNLREFEQRLNAAKKNQTAVYRVLTARSVQWKTVLSGDEQSMINQFEKVTKNE